MDRREFEKKLGLLVVAGVMGCKKDAPSPAKPATPQEPAPPVEPPPTEPPPPKPAPPASEYGYFKPAHVLTLNAALDRLIPADVPPGTPGASDAKALVFIDKLVQDEAFAGVGRELKGGVLMLNRVAMQEQRTPFFKLPPEQQDAILARFQTGEVPTGGFDSRQFFKLLMRYGLEGWLSHPRHGGNAGRVVWRSIGFAPRCGK